MCKSGFFNFFCKGDFIMSKIIKKSNSKPVAFGEEGYINLSGFTEISAESGRKGEIGITISDANFPFSIC